jgi:hypothetical protein
MTLFRKPVKGDYLRYLATGAVVPVPADWSDAIFRDYKDAHEFVTITVVEPPPKPKDVYVNIYQNNESLWTGGAYISLEECIDAAKVSTTECVGRVNLTKHIGTFDD